MIQRISHPIEQAVAWAVVAGYAYHLSALTSAAWKAKHPLATLDSLPFRRMLCLRLSVESRQLGVAGSPIDRAYYFRPEPEVTRRSAILRNMLLTTIKAMPGTTIMVMMKRGCAHIGPLPVLGSNTIRSVLWPALVTV